MDVVEQARMGLDELIDRMGRMGIEAVLQLSAQGIAGEKRRGKRGSDVLWHGSQVGEVPLRDRKIRLQRPRLRRRGQGRDGEVSVPAYEAMQSQANVGARMLEILMAGVSTRGYEGVIGEMAETVGVSKSAVRRRTGRVSRWQDGKMVVRWAAASYLDAEKRFRRILGYEHLWVLASALGWTTVAEQGKVG